LVFILIVLGGLNYWSDWGKQEQVNPEEKIEVSYEFLGTVQDVKDNKVYAKGYFVVQGQTNPPPNALNKNQVTIQITENTKFVRTVLTTPDPASLPPDKTFSFKDMNPVDEVGNLAILVKDKERSDITITVTASENINEQTVFTAEQISYRILAL
jgi:hypothetical protein